jgi:tetratricopeptide (TPR) repeat protein
MATRTPPRPFVALLLVLSTAASPACFASRRVHPRSAEQLRRGYAYVAGGDLERAEVAFSHALEFDPDLVEARNGLGVVARSRGDLETALRHFGDAVALDGSFSEGHANRGEALLAAGDDLAAAERALREALALNPDLVEARHNLGRALLRRGLTEPGERVRAWARARDAYLHVLEADPGRAGAHSDLALLDYLSGRPERAEGSWSRAAALAPTDADAAHGLCLARAAQGRCREAVPECERCLRLSPRDPRCAKSLDAATECAGTPPPR